MKEIVHTDGAPDAVGAYSQATTTGELVFTAGQIALTSAGDLLDDAPVAEQTEQALDNLLAILTEAGAEPTDVLKTTVFLADINDFDEMNDAYAGYFDESPPARSAVQVGALPKGADVEIEAVATVESMPEGEDTDPSTAETRTLDSDERDHDAPRSDVDRPGVPATKRARVKSAALWGVVGGFVFLVFMQGYLLIVGEVHVRYAWLFPVAVGVATVSGGLVYLTEHRIRSKRRT